MPHTKQQLEQLLADAQIAPRHRLGQNFLIDLNLMRLLVDTAALTQRDTVLEVGCGAGSLTHLLAERAGAVVAVEIDRELAQLAAGELQGRPNVSLICADILARKSAIEPAVLQAIAQARQLLAGPLVLVANLPFQVASPLIIDLLLERDMPEGIFITVQAEVAQRMAAQAGTHAYGLLSILMQATGRVDLLRRIKPQAFWPMPNVHSAMISWRRDAARCLDIRDMFKLKKAVELLLGHRRKTIRNCLALADAQADYEPLLLRLGISSDDRGETLGPDKFVALANLLAG